MLVFSRNANHEGETKKLDFPQRVIAQTNKKIDAILRGDLKILRNLSKYVVKSGGKRIRPLFLYYLGRAHHLPANDLIALGALLEIVHAASLLHDDVVDHADVRRGKPTAARLFGNKEVVLGGDHLLSTGLKYLNSLKNTHYMTVFTDAICALTEAELLQMEYQGNFATPLKIHARIVDGKTAVLFRAAGALVKILSNTQADFYHSKEAQLGELFGRYFQHRDDFLDYFDAKSLKKKGLQDFKNGIATRPLIFLRENANPHDRKILTNAWKNIQKGDVQSEAIVLSLMQKYAIEEKCRELLRKDEEEILDLLATLPEPKARRVLIHEFEKILAVRTK